MKSLITFLLALTTMFLSGCAGWQQDGGKTLATVAVTVDSAMKGWATYCATHDVPQDEHGAVRNSYIRYQIAMKSASEAYQAAVMLKDKSAWQQVQGALLASKDDIVTLIKTFTNKPMEAK